jgi:hypothetical protein
MSGRSERTVPGTDADEQAGTAKRADDSEPAESPGRVSGGVTARAAAPCTGAAITIAPFAASR